MSKNKKIIIGVIIAVVACVIIVSGTITYINYNKNKAVYINKFGDKYTETEMSTIRGNNESIKSLIQQLKQDQARNLGTLTPQAEKDLTASIPTVENDSAINIIQLQEQLLSNLQQDISSN